MTRAKVQASFVHGEVKRGHINTVPKALLCCGEEAPTPGPELLHILHSYGVYLMYIQKVEFEIACTQGRVPVLVKRKTARRQAGFSLVEISIVMAIVLLLSIIAIPTIKTYVIESKVPKVGEELARFILHTKINAPGDGSAPYGGISISNLAGMVKDSGNFAVSGSAASPTVRHGLGADGEVSVTQAQAGAAFSITLSKVNHAACPSLASVMQRLSDTIVLTPQSGSAATVKDANTPYSALETEARCSRGDGNTFVFTMS